MRRYSRAWISAAALGGAALWAAGGCKRAGAPGSPTEARLDAALSPAAFVAALRKIGGGHLRATTRLGAAPAAAPAPADPLLGPAPAPPPLDAVTTRTELWVDARGDFRLIESNDRDGGRDVVRRGRDLYVGIRHGKMIRRAAEDPEPDHLLEQAVGGPWAAWEMVRRGTALSPLPPLKINGRPTDGWKIAHAGTTRPDETKHPDLRRWRSSVLVNKVDGEVRLDAATGLPLLATVRGSYAMTRDGLLMRGEVAAEAEIDSMGTVSPIAPPADWDEIHTRQRTLPEEKALLGGLTPKKSRP